MTILFTFQSEHPTESLDNEIKFNKKSIQAALESRLTQNLDKSTASKYFGVFFKEDKEHG